MFLVGMTGSCAVFFVEVLAGDLFQFRKLSGTWRVVCHCLIVRLHGVWFYLDEGSVETNSFMGIGVGSFWGLLDENGQVFQELNYIKKGEEVSGTVLDMPRPPLWKCNKFQKVFLEFAFWQFSDREFFDNEDNANYILLIFKYTMYKNRTKI